MKIDNDFYSAEMVDGEWVITPKVIEKIKSTDKKYRDVPRYPLIVEYEKEFTSQYLNILHEMVFDIGKTLVKFTKP